MKPFEYGLYKPNESLLVVIDVQERLVPLMFDWQNLIKNTNTLLCGAQILGIPTLITEQYPKGLGNTDKRVEFDRGDSKICVLEKTSFSIFGNGEIMDFIAQLRTQGRAKNLIICGIESHICVLQSVFHALDLGLSVWVAQDALNSRKEANHLNAIELMRSKGAKISCVESLLFGAMLESKNEYFKQISALIK